MLRVGPSLGVSNALYWNMFRGVAPSVAWVPPDHPRQSFVHRCVNMLWLRRAGPREAGGSAAPGCCVAVLPEASLLDESKQVCNQHNVVIFLFYLYLCYIGY